MDIDAFARGASEFRSREEARDKCLIRRVRRGEEEGEGEGGLRRETKREEGKYLAAEVRVAREVDVDVGIEVGDASREVVVGETPATKHKRGERERGG